MVTTVVSMWLCGAALLCLALYAKRSARARVRSHTSGPSAQTGRKGS
ncbi:MAG: hypothetical protein ACFCUQ_11525 [Kiloniellales bacterium]